jgi:hypothetical protein
MMYAIQIIKQDGSKAVTMREPLAMAYLLAETPCEVKRLNLNSDNIKDVMEGSHGTWLDLMSREEEEALIDAITETQPSEAEALNRALRGH